MKNLTTKTHAESSLGGGYVSPEVKVVLIQPEGVLCSSGLTETFNEQDCTNGFWD